MGQEDLSPWTEATPKSFIVQCSTVERPTRINLLKNLIPFLMAPLIAAARSHGFKSGRQVTLLRSGSYHCGCLGPGICEILEPDPSLH